MLEFRIATIGVVVQPEVTEIAISQRLLRQEIS
jgi:hypothetical protein